MDWETIALSRVERHLEALSSGPGPVPDPPGESGWEESVLLALRRRIRGFKAE